MHIVNDRLYPSRAGGVNDRPPGVGIFLSAFADQPDLAHLSDSARRVLATAAALFYERGAAETSVRDLTRACGLTPGALYNHFASKDDLLYTLVRHGHVRMRRHLDESLDGLEDRPGAAFPAFVRIYVSGHLKQPELAQVVRREYLHLSPERHREVVGYRRTMRRRLTSVLAAGARDGTFALIDGPAGATRQAVMVLDMCSRTSEWFDRGGSAEADELAERYVTAALRLVGARPD
jgi:AcrR family transcriptional regulator